MNDYIILAVIAGLPLLLALVMRVSAVLLFLGVASGILLSQYIADDTTLALSTLFSHNHFDNYVKLVLLLLPVIVSIIFLRKTLPGSKIILHLVPFVLTSATLSVFVLSYLPGGVHYQLTSNPVGRAANSAQNLLVAVTTVVIMILALLTMRHSHSKKH